MYINYVTNTMGTLCLDVIIEYRALLLNLRIFLIILNVIILRYIIATLLMFSEVHLYVLAL